MTGREPIFISYAHGTSLTAARELKAQLGELAFLDESAIGTRERFTGVIADRLMEARLAVVFADEAYFDRPYCRWEWSLILRAGAMDHAYLTVPPGGAYALEALPPGLRTRNWNAPDLPAVLLAHLEKDPPTIGSLIAEQDREYLLESSREEAELPPVLTRALAAIPHRWSGMLDEASQAKFVGRAELLNELHQQLWLRHMGEPSSVALTAALHGAGGFGKSRLAAEYVHRYAPRCFTGGIFWMQCETELESQFHEVAQLLDPDTPRIDVLRQNQVSIPTLLREKVRAVVSRGRPVLFVLDNVPEVAGKLLPLEDYCPAKGLAALLITSRQRQRQAESIDVDAVTPLAAWLILTADLPRRSELTRAQWNEIGEWVGRLPLALEILNRALVNRARPVGEILRRAQGHETTPELDELAAALPEIERGVTETFEISYQALSDEGRQAARLLAELGPEAIPEILLEALQIASPAVRVELQGHSFVTGVAGDGMFGAMHRVLASFLREKSRSGGKIEEVEYFGRQRAEYVAAVQAVENIFWYRRPCRDPRNWRLHSGVVPHAEFLGMGSEYGESLLGVWLGILSNAQGDFARARKIEEQVLKVRRRVLGKEHPDTLTIMSNLASTLRSQGDLKQAHQIQTEQVEICRRVLGERHPDTLTSMGNLAHILGEQKDLEGARKLEEEVLAARLEVLGAGHPDTLASMGNLAQTCLAQGDKRGVREIEEQLLEARRQVQGKEHPDTLRSMNNLASTLWSEGNLEGARKLEEEVLRVRRRVLGVEHPDTVTTAWNLFLTLNDLKDGDAAAGVFTANLAQLLQKDPATLPAALHTIQAQLQHLNPAALPPRRPGTM